MHPYLTQELAWLHDGELFRDAEQDRRVRSLRPPALGGRGRWHGIKAAVGNRMVATGWRLLEAGLPHTR